MTTNKLFTIYQEVPGTSQKCLRVRTNRQNNFYRHLVISFDVYAKYSRNLVVIQW